VSAQGAVSEFRIAPDGSRVAYRADQLVDGRPELFTTRLDGTGNVPVSGPFVAGGAVALTAVFHWSPNSRHIAYLADQLDDQRVEVFVASPDGGGNLRVSGALFPTAQSGFGPTTPWAPNSRRLLYSASSFGLHPITVRPDGTGSVEVTGPFTPGGSASDGAWSRDGKRIAYRANQVTLGELELFAVDHAGGNHERVSGPMVPGGDVGLWKLP
jgi:Tol biopolymer transport system component